MVFAGERPSRHEEVTTLTTRSHRIGALVLALTLILTPAAAYADRISDKKAEAARVQVQIDALDDKVEIATEDYNDAADRYAKLTRRVGETNKKLNRLKGKQAKLQTHLYTRADNMYRTGRLGFLEVLLEAKSFDEFNTNWDLLTDMNERDAATVRELKVTRTEAEQTFASLKQSQTAAKKQKTAMAKNKKAVLAKLAERKRVLSGLNSDVRNLIAQRRAEEAAANRRAWLASSRSSGRAWVDSGGDPPSNASRGAQVVWWAKSRLGAPYVWAADGPNSFDCSGLTMWSYAKVGVSLPHSSRAQIGYGSRVSRDNLEPGDLVFFGRSRIHHVGIYVGDGMYIHAPSSGDVVKISSLGSRSDYAGASRP